MDPTERKERTTTSRTGKGNGEAAFTLAEVLIVIAIFAVLTTSATFTLRNLMRSNLRSAASRTAAAMRVAFDRAMLTGQFMRLVIDMEKGELWLEASEDKVLLRKGREQLATTDEKEAERTRRRRPEPSAPLPLFGLGGDEAEGAGQSEGEGEGGGLLGIDTKAMVEAFERDLEPPEPPKAYFQPVKGIAAKRIKLDSHVHVHSVMTPRLDKPVEKGQAYIYFFPQGNAEPAIVRLADDHEDHYSVVLHPLTGRTEVHSCLYRIPRQFGEDDLARQASGRVCED